MDWQSEAVLWLQAARLPWLDPLMWIPHALGSAAFYTLALPVLYLALGRRRGFDLFVVMILSFGLIDALKDAFGEVRPFVALGFAPLYNDVPATSPAFPSGHAMGTVAFWWSLAVLASRRWMFALALAVSVVVALSRVYGGVHWPSDVIGGLLLGLSVTAGAWWLLSRQALARHPGYVPLVTGAAMAFMLALAPLSDKVLPYVGLLLGLSGAHFAPDTPPPARDRSFWLLLVLPTLGVAAVVVGAAQHFFPQSVLARTVAYLLLGGYLTMASHLPRRWWRASGLSSGSSATPGV